MILFFIIPVICLGIIIYNLCFSDNSKSRKYYNPYSNNSKFKYKNTYSHKKSDYDIYDDYITRQIEKDIEDELMYDMMEEEFRSRIDDEIDSRIDERMNSYQHSSYAYPDPSDLDPSDRLFLNDDGELEEDL